MKNDLPYVGRFSWRVLWALIPPLGCEADNSRGFGLQAHPQKLVSRTSAEVLCPTGPSSGFLFVFFVGFGVA